MYQFFCIYIHGLNVLYKHVHSCGICGINLHPSLASVCVQPLRNALRLMVGGPTNLVPESFDGQMSYSVTSYLRKLRKQASVHCCSLSPRTSTSRFFLTLQYGPRARVVYSIYPCVCSEVRLVNLGSYSVAPHLQAKMESELVLASIARERERAAEASNRGNGM